MRGALDLAVAALALAALAGDVPAAIVAAVTALVYFEPIALLAQLIVGSLFDAEGRWRRDVGGKGVLVFATALIMVVVAAWAAVALGGWPILVYLAATLVIGAARQGLIVYEGFQNHPLAPSARARAMLFLGAGAVWFLLLPVVGGVDAFAAPERFLIHVAVYFGVCGAIGVIARTPVIGRPARPGEAQHPIALRPGERFPALGAGAVEILIALGFLLVWTGAPFATLIPPRALLLALAYEVYLVVYSLIPIALSATRGSDRPLRVYGTLYSLAFGLFVLLAGALDLIEIGVLLVLAVQTALAMGRAMRRPRTFNPWAAGTWILDFGVILLSASVVLLLIPVPTMNASALGEGWIGADAAAEFSLFAFMFLATRGQARIHQAIGEPPLTPNPPAARSAASARGRPTTRPAPSMAGRRRARS